MGPFVWLLPTVREVARRPITLADSGGRVVAFCGLDKVVRRLLPRLDGSQRASDLAKGPADSLVLKILAAQRWLVRLQSPLHQLEERSPALTRELAFLACVERIDPDRHLNLSGRKVVIAGVGGVGAQIAFALASRGVSDLYLIDPDTIDQTNLNRQPLLHPHDVGNAKAAVIASRIAERFPNVRVRGLRAILGPVHAKATDLLVLSSDARFAYDSPRRFKSAIVIPAGYLGSSAAVGPVCGLPGGACWPCFVKATRSGRTGLLQEPTRTAWNSSSSTINLVAAGLAAELAHRALASQVAPRRLLGCRLLIDLKTFRTKYVGELTPCTHHLKPTPIL